MPLLLYRSPPPAYILRVETESQVVLYTHFVEYVTSPLRPGGTHAGNTRG